MKVLVEVSKRLYKSALAYNFDMLDGIEAMRALKEGTVVNTFNGHAHPLENEDTNNESS